MSISRILRYFTTLAASVAFSNTGPHRQLYGRLLEVLGNEDSVHRTYGGVVLSNPASIHLHEALGFIHVATYHEVVCGTFG